MQVLVFDSEVYRNYYLAAFRNVATGEVRTFELYDEHPLDANGLREVLRSNRIVTFNGNHFDMPLIALALRGATAATLKEGADAIILNNMAIWKFEKRFGVRVPTSVDHIDVFEVAAGNVSLKAYGARLHCRKLQDLPIEPDADIAPEQRPLLREYCGNDLELTAALYTYLLPNIQLRERMSAAYGMDLRSKSDAQIAEAVICSAVSRVQGHDVERPTVKTGTIFRYQRPAFIEFTTEALKTVLSLIEGLEFVVPGNGRVMLPAQLKNLEIPIGTSVYRMGIGGLHSCEKSIAHIADADTVLSDRDVASYYPAIILQTGLAPAHMGSAFTDSFKSILQRRLDAKRAGDKVTADSLKITVNGSFGKFGSKWSKLYAPNLMMQTTITGQLALLMLIEMLEEAGIPVVSANTDGVVIKCPRSKLSMMEFLVWLWEESTGFETEAAEYQALYSRDVNNYIALKKGTGVKRKGAYAPQGMVGSSWPAPANEVCTDAIIKYLADGTPVEQSIAACTDVRKFVTVRQVKGGAVKDGEYLGKAIRWYYSFAVCGDIKYKLNGYTVPRTDGAMPLMELPDSVPGDIDYDWYINEATSILKDIGAITNGTDRQDALPPLRHGRHRAASSAG